MSLEKKSIHIRITPDLHNQLKLMAQFHNKNDSELAALLLEKSIVGEFHEFSLAAERYKRLGLFGNEGEGGE